MQDEPAIDYMPRGFPPAFPGTTRTAVPLNQIPRQRRLIFIGDRFTTTWHVGFNMIYGAMFERSERGHSDV